MWSVINSNTSQNKRTTSSLKPLKLVSKVPEPSPVTPSPLSTDITAPPETWRKEFRLIRVVERERKKLSVFTSSTTSTYASSSSSSSREPITPTNLPHLNNRLLLLDEKLEIFENKITAREHLFDILEKDSDRLHLDLQKELRRGSQALPSSTPSEGPKNDKDGVKPSEAVETTENIQQSLPKADDGPAKADDTPNASGQVTMDSNPDAAAGWGGYFKKFW